MLKYIRYGCNRKKVYFEEKVEIMRPEPSWTAVKFTE